MAMHTGRILIAGGDRLDALDLQQRLARMSHLVLAIARSSDEALQLAGVLRPDAVVMDARLPGLMDSIQAGTHIWARLGIPVVYRSEHVPEVRLQRLWPGSLAGLLSTHTGAHDLRQALEEMLARCAPPPVDPTTQGRSPLPPSRRPERRRTSPSHHTRR
jgi:DNA-binding NarL/FixJ family response regulator